MALTNSQIVYSFTVTTGTNDAIDFFRGATNYNGTVAAGVYAADDFAAAVQTAMVAQDNGNNYAVTIDYTTPTAPVIKFTGTAAFTIKWGTGTNHLTSCHGQCGFASSDTGSATTQTGGTVGSANSTAKMWTLVDPLVNFSPVTAAAFSGSIATGLLLQRVPRFVQNTTDGGAIETVYYSTVKRWRATFNWLSSAEQTNMESFLDWAIQGKPFLFQPDKTTNGVLRLVCAPQEISNTFSWITRNEADYAELTFYEQLS